LLYTGLTRARSSLILAGSREAITRGTTRSRPRSSGLSAMLRKREGELS
jgi:ATP-dependent exoDNAse (exonuclease V) alpha subunit